MSIWNGRFDGTTPEHLRFFQKIEIQETNTHNTKPIQDSYQIIGFCCDEGVERNKGIIGAKNAPDYIRTAMASLPYINHQNGTPTYSLSDRGNIACTDKDLNEAQSRLANRVESIIRNNHTAIILGGGHETAFGVFKGLHQAYPVNKKIGIVNFDAHFDLRTTTDNIPTSGTPFNDSYRLCKKDNRSFHYFCMGVAQSGNTKALFDTADTLGVQYIYDRQCNIDPQSALKSLLNFIKSVDVLYITIDMDTFNAGIAPGVSALNPMGLHPAFVEHCIIEMTKSGTPISALDTVEVNPIHDQNMITAKLASRLIHTFITHNCTI